jgi:putative methyltransferase (TIGR04325 family)
MNQWKLKLLKKLPWSLVSKSPSFGYANTWVGLYPNWSAAMAAIPKGNPVGYDQDAAREMFTQYPTSLVRPSDYAVLVHLRNFARAGMRVVDVGGSIGTAYYIAQKYFPLPEPFCWVIYDVPAVLEAGRAVAAREGERGKGLSFVGSLKDAGECDVFFSSGSLQLIEETLPQLLQQLPGLPEHVLINRVPVWDRDAIVCLNDMGFSLAPYNIFNRKQWVGAMEELGYKLVDDWACPESKFSIKFKRGTRLNAYSGFYFRRES